MSRPDRSKPATASRIVAIPVALLFCAAASTVSAEPTPFAASYRVDLKGLPVTAKGHRTLERMEDGRYRLTSEARSFLATATEETMLRWNGTRVVPQEYRYQRKGIGRNRSVTVTFDWTAGVARTVTRRETQEVGITEGVLDKLGYQMQLREELMRAESSGPIPQKLSYTVADGDELRDYLFEVQGEERLETALGDLLTLRIARIHRSARRTTLFWLAPEWEYLLVRLRQTEKGAGSFDLLLEEAELGGRAVRGIGAEESSPGP